MAILSLDEAASALGLTKDALKDLARSSTIRSFRAGNTITFGLTTFYCAAEHAVCRPLPFRYR